MGFRVRPLGLGSLPFHLGKLLSVPVPQFLFICTVGILQGWFEDWTYLRTQHVVCTLPVLATMLSEGSLSGTPVLELEKFTWCLWVEQALGEGTQDSEAWHVTRVHRAVCFCHPQEPADPTVVPLTSGSCCPHTWSLWPFLTLSQSCSPLFIHSHCCRNSC